MLLVACLVQQLTSTVVQTKAWLFLGDNFMVLATGVDEIRINDFLVSSLLHVPDLHCNLLSVYSLADEGIYILFEGKQAKITLNGQLLALAH